MKKITIIGSGLAGTLLAVYLAKRGYALELFESRPDLRMKQTDQGRSINLALSCRGITGMAAVGIMPKVKKLIVPMRARAIHELRGQIKFQPFGRNPDEYINAIQRNDLNKLLLNEVEKFPQVTLNFDTPLIDLDVKRKTAIFSIKNNSILKHQYDFLIGADGANSTVRKLLQAKHLIQATRTFLPYGYKELSIGKPGQNHLIHEHLHLWPRDDCLLLGNPNLDQSITGSLFLSYEGFAELNNEHKIKLFFERSFPDAYSEMPNIISEFTQHPIGSISTIKCNLWYYEEQCLLMGDAAHGVVPFFGQGMNSAFEDCRVLNELLDQYKEDWAKAIPGFYQSRKRNTDAVAQMSLDNFHEIQIDIRDKRFNLKKQLEYELMRRYPEYYVSKHVLVMFTNTPYAETQALGKLNEEFLNSLCNHIERIEAIDWNDIKKKLISYYKN